jgi:TetR/AcrR family transcriptional regulator, cholesterol catabolism regulator
MLLTCRTQRSGTRLPRATGQDLPAVTRRDRQRRREELIEIACHIFAEKGFDGATLQDIADQFGVLKGSLFHYIQSKDDLLFEIIDRVYAGAEDAIWSIARADDTAVSRLRRLIVAYVRYVTDHQPAITVWLHDLNCLDPVRGQVIRQREEHNRRRLVELITQAQQEGGVHPDADPHLVAFALLGSMNWVHRWFRPRGASATEIGEEFSTIYLSWPAAKPEATGS